MRFARKDFITLKDVTEEEILYILDTAETMKHVINQKNKKAPYLAGKTVVTLFGNILSRNKLSYELAAQYLSANVVDLKINGYGQSNGNLLDLGKIIDQMGGDFIILRHPMSGSAQLLSKSVEASVMNAGDGMNEDPSQALLDLLTIRSHKGSFKGLKVAIVGDILHSRVTKSNIWGLLTLGAEVVLAGPPTLVPDALAQLGVQIYYDANKAVEDADVIMALRMQSEDQYGSLLPSFNEYKNFFKIDRRMMLNAKSDVIVMHPGPINRGIEISSEVIDSKQCLVEDQITNGVAVRMALLYLLSIKGGKNFEIVD